MDLDGRVLAEAVAELVRIPSVNPLHTGPRAEEHGPVGEGAIARHLADRFDRCGAAEVVLDEVRPDRPNVYGRFPGRSDRLVVLDVHTDTVAVEHMTDPPFDGRIEHDAVWGRGALDTKATMGVVLALLAAMHRDGRRPDPTLLLVGSIGEEAGGLLGATRFAPWARQQGLRIDQLLVAEPTGFRPVHGLKGLVLIEVTTHGVAAHSARPDLGVNAIDAMVPVLAAFAAAHERLSATPGRTELGGGTLSVTQITGGSGSNVIPDRCSITVGRRIVPGEDPVDVLAELTAIARAACPVPCDVVSLLPRTPDGRPASPAFYQRPDSGLVQFLARTCGTRPTVAPFGANALRYSGLAEELVVFGPGSIEDAHQATERIDIPDLRRLADVLTSWLSPG
ncbi:M20 family metallopeptidase [Micromonospora antibiotica]|uniref:M20/M25/M40 family metallo-hydrolase n=1 Tax=Micromonospora antibiotica TaxID=2807623 RepID=A0ABS3VCG6_9ACTN|nr:M20/M25/M40 family metallo-hydrolase [Micromonospora antibiotica]MBO4163272.1 M20/M25/M40 family metallo-hydrolase [Micromonospora antibiotica]